MDTAAIFLPMSALAILTLSVLLLIPVRRFKSAFANEVTVNDFRYGESPKVPGSVSIPNRNMMNLLELPVLFYVLCLTAYVTGQVTDALVILAWAYFGLRLCHSIVHLTYNNVFHRLTLFAVSNVLLVLMWILLIRNLL
jgi:hypothetical protein